MKAFQALIKREFWEHKGAFFLTPTVLAGVMAAFMILGTITSGTVVINDDTNFSLMKSLPQMIQKFEQAPESQRALGVQTFLYSQGIFLLFVLLLISVRYALSCLYEERKDRSILFWKSLPLSDTQTVLSKVVALLVMVPLIYALVIVAFQLFTLLFATVLAWFSDASGASFWAASAIHTVGFNTIISVLILSLWLTPVYAWLMLASCWAKKAPMLWASIPLLAVVIGEGWIFNSGHFASMIGKYIGKGFEIVTSNVGMLLRENGATASVQWKDQLTIIHPFDAFSQSEFWIGILLSAIFVSGAVYLRRFRDES